MRLLTFILLISALALALLAIPLTIAFQPLGIASCLAAVLIAVVAVPDLVRQDEAGEPLGGSEGAGQ